MQHRSDLSFDNPKQLELQAFQEIESTARKATKTYRIATPNMQFCDASANKT